MLTVINAVSRKYNGKTFRIDALLHDNVTGECFTASVEGSLAIVIRAARAWYWGLFLDGGKVIGDKE